MKNALLAAKQDWRVWTHWYGDRLDGRIMDEERELAYVRIEEALWDQGQAIVNAEALQLAGPLRRRRARRRRPPSDEDSKPSSPELVPPEAPLSLPSPATRFIVQQGIVDVVPPTAWAGREAQVAAYHARARTIASGLAVRLANTDAAPEVSGSVNALFDVLGDDPGQLQPDQLRLASRTIASKARAYGHPSAQWELSVESVSALLDAATSTIKHLPKTIPVLAGLVYAAIVGAPALLAAGGGLSVSLAWIGYELWKRKKPPG
jgi:hypothetical protein